MEEASKELKERRYTSRHISPREFYDYMTGETPTGDTITILDVLDDEYLKHAHALFSNIVEYLEDYMAFRIKWKIHAQGIKTTEMTLSP